MMRLERTPAPTVLIEHGPRWCKQFVALCAADPCARFRWPVHKGEPINRLLVAELLRLTTTHCSYCDGYPLGATSRETIDHFRPKHQFPELSYVWENLF